MELREPLCSNTYTVNPRYNQVGYNGLSSYNEVFIFGPHVAFIFTNHPGI